MSKIVTVHIEGLREVQVALRSMLPDRTARNVMRRVLTKRAQPVAAAARALAPKRTGQLKESIAVVPYLSRRQRADSPRVSLDDVEVYVATTGSLPQAHMSEWGTSRQSAHPYMRPAWDATKMGIIPGIGEDIWDEIKKAVARAARKAARAAG